MNDEVGKYRKKKQSNTSKSKYKSKHKHEYKSCLICYRVHGKKLAFINIASYCTVCGKIGKNIDHSRRVTEKTDSSTYRMLSPDEVLKRNNDLLLFEVEFGDKYISVENI